MSCFFSPLGISTHRSPRAGAVAVGGSGGGVMVRGTFSMTVRVTGRVFLTSTSSTSAMRMVRVFLIIRVFCTVTGACGGTCTFSRRMKGTRRSAKRGTSSMRVFCTCRCCGTLITRVFLTVRVRFSV